MTALVWCPDCYSFRPAHGQAGCEVVDVHDQRRGVRCSGSTRPWLELERRAKEQGPASVTGAT